MSYPPKTYIVGNCDICGSPNAKDGWNSEAEDGEGGPVQVCPTCASMEPSIEVNG